MNNKKYSLVDLKSIINGYIMGDGYLKPNGTLTVDQGHKQKKFVEWFHEHLKPLCTPKSKVAEVTRKRECNGKVSITRSFRFNTRAVLKDEYNNWYQQDPGSGKAIKKLPSNLDQFFTPLFITVWFAGDGTKPLDYRGSRFEVTAYTPEERQRLQKLFKDLYEIEVEIIKNGVSKKGTQQWCLSINSANYDKFRDLITRDSLIPTLFPYKLHSKKP